MTILIYIVFSFTKMRIYLGSVPGPLDPSLQWLKLGAFTG